MIMTPVKDAELAGVRYRDDMGGLEQTYSTGKRCRWARLSFWWTAARLPRAELLAGSLQDTGSATLIGSKTYGKGQGQFHIDLVNGDKLVITTLELELPKQGCWEGVGLTPDIQLENRKVTVNTKDLQTARYEHNPAFWRQLGRGLRHDRAPVAAGTAHRSNRQV